MDDSDKRSKDVADDVKTKAYEKQGLIKEVEKLQNEIAQKDGLVKKCGEDLVVYKAQKHFLDILAMQAGLKRYNPKF